MDETEYEDGETAGALGAASPFGTREEYLAAYGQAVEGQRQAAQAETQARRQAFEQAQRYIEQNSYGRPTQSEQLMRLSQALLSPRRSRGFGGTLANVVPALAENQQLMRRADEQRAEALMRLQQEYATGNAAAGTAAANAEVEALGRLAPNFRQSGDNAIRFDPNAATGGYTLRPGTGGLPPINTLGHYIVNSPEQIALLRRMAPNAVFVAADDPTGTPRYVTPR